MKNLILFTLLIIGMNFTKAQDYSSEIGLKISYLLWNNSEINDSYGGIGLFGGDLAFPISEDFKIELSADYGAGMENKVKLEYIQAFGDRKYSFSTWDSQKPSFYFFFGGGLVYLKQSISDESIDGNGFAFRIGTGIEIPVDESVKFDFGWKNTLSQIEYGDEDYNENINVGGCNFLQE